MGHRKVWRQAGDFPGVVTWTVGHPGHGPVDGLIVRGERLAPDEEL